MGQPICALVLGHEISVLAVEGGVEITAHRVGDRVTATVSKTRAVAAKLPVRAGAVVHAGPSPPPRCNWETQTETTVNQRELFEGTTHQMNINPYTYRGGVA
jgi:hypothetical protein